MEIFRQVLWNEGIFVADFMKLRTINGRIYGIHDYLWQIYEIQDYKWQNLWNLELLLADFME